MIYTRSKEDTVVYNTFMQGKGFHAFLFYS